MPIDHWREALRRVAQVIGVHLNKKGFLRRKPG